MPKLMRAKGRGLWERRRGAEEGREAGGREHGALNAIPSQARRSRFGVFLASAHFRVHVRVAWPPGGLCPFTALLHRSMHVEFW